MKSRPHSGQAGMMQATHGEMIITTNMTFELWLCEYQSVAVVLFFTLYLIH